MKYRMLYVHSSCVFTLCWHSCLACARKTFPFNFLKMFLSNMPPSTFFQAFFPQFLLYLFRILPSRVISSSFMMCLRNVMLLYFTGSCTSPFFLGQLALWYGHVSRSSGLAKTILQGTVRGGRRRGRQKKRWEDNIKEWTGMEFADSQRAVENRETWRELVRKSSMVPQRSLRVMGK